MPAEITDWKINVRSSAADVGAKLADFFLKITPGWIDAGLGNFGARIFSVYIKVSDIINA